MRPHVLTLDDLSKGSLTQDIQNEVSALSARASRRPRLDSSPVTSVLASQHIVDVENIVIIFVIRSLIVDRLARLRENTTRVIGSLVAKLRIAQRVGLGEIGCQTL